MKIIMLGGPGAGKGTQADKIAKKYDIPHISTGDLFRANLSEGTELGKKASEYMNRGELVPDEITVGMLVDRIGKPDCAQGYVLDGFPRSIPQAESLARTLEAAGDGIDHVINVDVPDEVILTRMSGRRACKKCGATYHIVFNPPKQEGVCDSCGDPLVQRDDDREETVRHRLEVYHAQTEPLIRYYGGLVRTVDGTQPLEKVFEDITGILGD